MTTLHTAAQQALTDEQIDSVIHALDKYGRDADEHDYGLPIYGEERMPTMRKLVRAALATPQPLAVPAQSPAEGDAAELVADLMLLVDEYWDAAYAEGKEGRTADTADALAQRTRTAIHDAAKRLAAQPQPKGTDEPVAWMDDGTKVHNGPGHPVFRVITADTKQNMPASIQAEYTTPLYAHQAPSPAPAHESKGDEPLRDVAQRALEVLAFVGDWDHRGESVAEAWNAHATAADGWNALLQDLEAALSQPAAHPIWLGMRESVLCEAANAVGEQMKRWPTDHRAVYVAAECAAAVRALIANPQAKGPVKVWCETCNGSGEAHQEHQAGCWVGGSHACPDCDGKGYSERATQAPAVGAPPSGFALVSLADLTDWRMRVNDMACLTLKAERHRAGADLKGRIATVIAEHSKPPVQSQGGANG